MTKINGFLLNVETLYFQQNLTKMLKEKINAKGLKLKWIAEQINVNYSSLRVYINNESLMPENIKTAIKKLLS